MILFIFNFHKLGYSVKIRKMFQNKSILITGGTGSFGKEFCIFLIKKKISFRKIILFSRDEFKQSNFSDYLKSNFPKDYKKIRFVIGDVRDSQSFKICT